MKEGEDLKAEGEDLKRVAIHTLGCRLNQSESALIAHGFERHAYRVVDSEESPDVCVINTCTVTEQSSSKSRQIIRALSRQNPDALIAVTGCYAQMESQTLSQLEEVDLVVGNEAKLSLADHVESLSKASISDPNSAPIIRPKLQKKLFHHPFKIPPLAQKTRFHLKIQDGCDFMCSFCIIPFARGRSRYREFSDVCDEARNAVQLGVQEIVITGVNIGTYQEGTHSLVEFVDFLNDLPQLQRIRISSIEPTTCSPVLLQYMAEPSHKLTPFLHLPLQSGCSDILHHMKRRYNAEEYAEEVWKAYEQVPDLCIGTDVMAGFPGETQAAFEESLSLLESLPIAYFHVFPFSVRQGTPAAKMPAPVASEVKQERAAMLRKLSQQKRRAFQKRFLGSTQKVLLESRKADGSMEGYTENYLRIVLSHPPESFSENQIVSLHLKEITNHHILGEMLL